MAFDEKSQQSYAFMINVLRPIWHSLTWLRSVDEEEYFQV